MLTAKARAAQTDKLFAASYPEKPHGDSSNTGFKRQGTEGILACKIRSIIIPLLGDHVLRKQIITCDY